jgi:DNA replication protein DnaC
MSQVKTGFNWKTIEEKPHNWETIRHLIQDAYAPVEEIPDKYWGNQQLLHVFLETFPDLKNWIQLEAPTKTLQKKSKSKKPPSKKEEIQQRVESELIKKEMQNIRFDAKTLQPVKTKFDMQIMFLLMMMVWNYMLYQKRKTAPKKTMLDAILSFHRVYTDERSQIQQPDLLQSLDHISGILKTLVDDEMYEVLFQNPSLLVDCTAQRRGKPKKLYAEQKRVLEEICARVKNNEPLLLGNQMPTGTGKTFLAVPLAKKLSMLRPKKTVLFACSNELVNKDVASTALLGDDLHVWLAKLIRPEGTSIPMILLRPHKRCFPATWKKVYKKEDKNKMGTVEEQWNFYTKATGKIPDILVADLEAAFEILKEAPQMDDPFLAYIDEFVSDDASNRLMAMISHHLPRQTVLLSAILPKFDSMPHIVNAFLERHDASPQALYRVATADVNISCAVVDQGGFLRMPHHQVKTVLELEHLHREILVNPRIRRAYPIKHVYHWARSMESVLSHHGLTFSERFPDIGTITTSSVIDYAIDLIAWLVENPEHIFDFQQYRPSIMPAPEAERMFREQAIHYDGKTLFITNHVMAKVDHMVADVFDKDLKWGDIVSETRKNEMYMEKRLEKLESAKMTRIEKERMVSELSESCLRSVLPSQYVLNSREHFERYHPQETLQAPPRTAIDLPNYFESAFDDQMNMMMAAGIGLYCKTHMTEYQRNLVMGIYDKLLFLCSGKDIVFGTNLPGLTNVFIDESFASDQSISTLYQLMGRVGRMGRSYHANIILNSEEGVRKILSMENNIDHESAASLETYFLEA